MMELTLPDDVGMLGDVLFPIHQEIEKHTYIPERDILRVHINDVNVRITMATSDTENSYNDRSSRRTR